VTSSLLEGPFGCWGMVLMRVEQEEEVESPQSLASAAALEWKRLPEEHTTSLDRQVFPAPCSPRSGIASVSPGSTTNALGTCYYTFCCCEVDEG
jgi:hypothetical protein